MRVPVYVLAVLAASPVLVYAGFDPAKARPAGPASTTVGLSARINYTVTPQLTLQLYARPFVSAGGYGRFKELTNGRAASYGERYEPYPYAGNPDFNVRPFRTTNVVRWEYRPGSVLFVVWQQGRDGFAQDGRFRFGDNFGDVFEADATNVFLVKFSRGLNF